MIKLCIKDYTLPDTHGNSRHVHIVIENMYASMNSALTDCDQCMACSYNDFFFIRYTMDRTMGLSDEELFIKILGNIE